MAPARATNCAQILAARMDLNVATAVARVRAFSLDMNRRHRRSLAVALRMALSRGSFRALYVTRQGVFVVG